MRIIKNIIKNELFLIGFMLLQEVIRLVMKASKDMFIDLELFIIMFIMVAILSVIQQIIKEKYIKRHER